MADASSPFSQPHHHQSKSNFPMLYYGLVVVGTAALVLLTYNLIIIRWCTNRQARSPARPPGRAFSELPSSRSSEHMNRNLLSSFKYKKEVEEVQKEEGDEYECAVCLSVFEEGEEVRKLPRCTHTFHALCIDMWLYSHSDCPLCRAPVAPSHCYRHVVSSGQILPGSAVSV